MYWNSSRILAEYITGAKITDVCAESTVEGRMMDDDGSIIKI
jgi:hypothetical protein